ncbi:hypothetical protein HUJ05_004391 [Dendroctonus ponderosae]|nr:hypothetical protein HUJ05_004391 [Dendroctonus ponderosae]
MEICAGIAWGNQAIPTATEKVVEENKTCGKILTVLAWGLVVLTMPFSLFVCFKVVQEYERAVIFRLGRLLSGGAKGPVGLFNTVYSLDKLFGKSSDEHESDNAKCFMWKLGEINNRCCRKSEKTQTVYKHTGKLIVCLKFENNPSSSKNVHSKQVKASALFNLLHLAHWKESKLSISISGSVAQTRIDSPLIGLKLGVHYQLGANCKQPDSPSIINSRQSFDSCPVQSEELLLIGLPRKFQFSLDDALIKWNWAANVLDAAKSTKLDGDFIKSFLKIILDLTDKIEN